MFSSSVLTASLCLLLCLLMCLSPPEETVTVKPGDDATLQCHSPAGAEIIVIKWDKSGLESKLYVFYYREKRPYENFQLPSYRGRVELKDPEMKDGDVSVVLKNVTFNDTGRYECHVGATGSEPKLIKAVNLTVTDSGDTEERGGDKEGGDRGLQIGLGVGLPAALLVVVALVVVGFIFYGKCIKSTEGSHPVGYKAADPDPLVDG